MVKQAKIVAVLTCFLFLAPFIAGAAVVEQLIVVINGEPYTLSSVNTYAKTKMSRGFPTGSLDQINATDRETLEQFITDKLMEAEVRESGIIVTDEEVNRYIETVKQNNRLSDEELKTALSREGQTLASYKTSVKTEMEKSEVIERQVKRKVSVSDEDVERYYKLNAKKYRLNDRAHIRHILLSLKENAPAEDVQREAAKAKELYAKIGAGADFAKLAQEYSEGAGRAAGGDIGWVTRGTLIAGIEEVAFDKLKIGQVSEPFRTSMGIHIVKLEGRESGNVQPLSAVAPKIKEELLNKALEERFARWLKTDLRRKNRVDVKVAGVVFKPEDSKEATLNSLAANSSRTTRRQPERTFMSYLNPFSYIVKETPFDDEDPKSPLAGKSVVTVLGVPVGTTDAIEDAPDVLNPPPPPAEKGTMSKVLDSLNPFSSKKP